MGEFEKESFARAILNGTYDLDVVVPVDDEAALQEVIADVDGLLALNDRETRQRRHKHFNIPGTTEDNYYERSR